MKEQIAEVERRATELSEALGWRGVERRRAGDPARVSVREVQISKSETAWRKFSEDVAEHIAGYVVPQYGDAGVDPVTDYTAADCILQIKRYVNRYGRNARPGQQQLDLIKIAHYAQLAAGKKECSYAND
jgi:hypothetical protein